MDIFYTDICGSYTVFLYTLMMIDDDDFWRLTPLSAIFQLYPGF
jgi:hypothetical protein